MFLHISELEKASIDPAAIKKGQRVHYEPTTFNGKPKASHIRLTGHVD
jgi:cold shock CspA family protein